MSEHLNGEYGSPKVEWRSLRHGCDVPEIALYAPGLRLRWKCPECGTKWRYDRDRSYRWDDVSPPSRRWRKAQARLVAAALSGGQP